MVNARSKSTQVPVSCLWKAECTIELVTRKLALMAIKNYWPVWGKFKQTMFRIWDVKQNKWNVYCNGLTVKGIVPQDCGFFIKSTWAPDQRIKIFTILVFEGGIRDFTKKSKINVVSDNHFLNKNDKCNWTNNVGKHFCVIFFMFLCEKMRKPF